MMLDELFVVVILVIFIVISLPFFVLEAFLIIAHIIEDKEQKDEFNRISQQNKDGGGEV